MGIRPVQLTKAEAVPAIRKPQVPPSAVHEVADGLVDWVTALSESQDVDAPYIGGHDKRQSDTVEDDCTAGRWRTPEEVGGIGR
jgi:hypothetical protein